MGTIQLWIIIPALLQSDSYALVGSYFIECIKGGSAPRNPEHSGGARRSTRQLSFEKKFSFLESTQQATILGEFRPHNSLDSLEGAKDIDLRLFTSVRVADWMKIWPVQ